MKNGKPIDLNMMTGHKKSYHLCLDVTVGGEDLEDALDSVKMMLDDHAEELFIERNAK